MIYLRAMNRKQSARRVAVGKSKQTVDLSLETAAEAERIERQQQEQPAPNECAEDNADGKNDKASLDATDRENEDFVYVY